ncbi:hypothetical protein [Chamaesiphon sp. OTE_20_metabat_361]|uniref:hypothetical protein n=1 Tax=Chamaesiphon sp. OTE_20_metabat_361 TaxID=2964689 RepID=UPI00286B52FF|nr:hypothetical protein [Chamaesiphon sp. OTE_20_metabat_361]
MTKSDYSIPNTDPVSAVTKHIKIYSDNPIHDAIDRIIDSCLCIDEGHDECHVGSIELRNAAEDLLILAVKRLAQIQRQHERVHNEQKYNQS